MASQQIAQNLEQGDVVLPETGRPVVRSREGVISSGHYLTSMAGVCVCCWLAETLSTPWWRPGLLPP